MRGRNAWARPGKLPGRMEGRPRGGTNDRVKDRKKLAEYTVTTGEPDVVCRSYFETIRGDDKGIAELFKDISRKFSEHARRNALDERSEDNKKISDIYEMITKAKRKVTNNGRKALFMCVKSALKFLFSTKPTGLSSFLTRSPSS